MPPFGEDYGFPKPVPTFRSKNDFRKWMLINGYPRQLIDQGQLDYCKFYEQDIFDGTDYSTET